MGELIKELKKNKYNFDIGTLINEQFLELQSCFIKNCIRIKIKENYYEKLNNILENTNVNIRKKMLDKYHAIYEVEEKSIFILNL